MTIKTRMLAWAILLVPLLYILWHFLRITLWPVHLEFGDHWTLDVVKEEAYLWPADVVVGDINNDGIDDLVVPMGQDHDEEPIAIYWGQPAATVVGHEFAPFAADQVWWGPAHGYHTACLADINADGCLDMVTAQGGSSATSTHSLFLNQPVRNSTQCAGFTTEQPLTLPDLKPTNSGWRGLGCDFADVDGDGDHDLLASLSYRAVGVDYGLLAIYPNDSGSLQDPSWQNDEPDNRQSFDVLFTDANLDGQLDIVASSIGVRVYLGNGSSFPVSRDWHWAANANSYSKGIDAALAEDDAETLSIALAVNNRTGYSSFSYGHHHILRFCSDGTDCDAWQSSNVGKGDDVVLMRLNDDTDLDLASGRQQQVEGDHHKALVYWNPLDAGTEVHDLSANAGQALLTQGIVAWAFPAKSRKEIEYEVEVSPGQRVVYFRGNAAKGTIVSISEVASASGNHDFVFDPGDRWFTLQSPFTSATEISVKLIQAPTPDLIYGDGEPGQIHFFRNKHN